MRRSAAFYEMALRFHLTTDTSPTEVHRIGLEQVAATQTEARAKDPAQLFPNIDAGRDALLAFVRERTEDLKRCLSGAFTRLPRTPMEVRRVPVAIQLGAPFAYSTPSSIDGIRSGVIYFIQQAELSLRRSVKGDHAGQQKPCDDGLHLIP